ncbi:MAG: flippase [Patescibacteria group bacterium]
MNVAKAFAKNSILQLSGKLFGTLLGLLTFWLILHFFDTDGFGLFTTAMTYVTIFAIIVDFGLTLTTTQLISEAGADEAKLLGNLVSLRTLTAVIFMSLCPITAAFIPQSEGIMNLIVLGSITYFISAVAQMFQGVFQKRLNIGMVVVAETANRVISITGIVIAGLTGAGIVGATVAFLVGIVVQLIIMLGATNQHVKFRPQMDLAVWATIIKRSWPIGVSILFNLLYLRGDIFFMWIFGISPTEIGQYGSAYKVVDVVTMLPVTLMGLLLPILTMAWSQKRPKDFQQHLQTGFDILAIISVPFACGAIVLGVPLMMAVKPDLVLAGQVLRILGPAIAVLCFGSLYGHAVVAINKQKPMMLAYALVAVFAVTGYVLYIPLYGAWAAAWITLASEILIGVLAYLVVTLTVKQPLQLKQLGRVIIASVIMTVAITFIPTPHVALSVLMGMLVYGIVLAGLGGPNPNSLLKVFKADKLMPPTITA